MLRPCIVLLLFVSLITSCSHQNEYTDFRDIEAKGWNRYDTLRYDFKIHDNQSYDMVIETRNTLNYPYRNIYLFVNCKMGKKVIFSDTIQTQLADKLGNWLGSGWGSLYTVRTNYKHQFRFPKANQQYQIQVVQGMRDFDLVGIESVGLTVSPSK